CDVGGVDQALHRVDRVDPQQGSAEIPARLDLDGVDLAEAKVERIARDGIRRENVEGDVGLDRRFAPSLFDVSPYQLDVVVGGIQAMLVASVERTEQPVEPAERIPCRRELPALVKANQEPCIRNRRFVYARLD